MNKKELGTKAETEVCNYLKNSGYEIQDRNYRYRRSEIDIIAVRDGLMVFVEVKFRTSESYGYPEEFVSETQKNSIIHAADHYISQKNWSLPIRFDIVSLDKKMRITHFEDAFY